MHTNTTEGYLLKTHVGGKTYYRKRRGPQVVNPLWPRKYDVQSTSNEKKNECLPDGEECK